MKTVSEQMELARKAQAIVNDYTQEQIDEICLAIGWEVYEDENIAKLAKMAVEETGYATSRARSSSTSARSAACCMTSGRQERGPHRTQ